MPEAFFNPDDLKPVPVTGSESWEWWCEVCRGFFRASPIPHTDGSGSSHCPPCPYCSQPYTLFAFDAPQRAPDAGETNG